MAKFDACINLPDPAPTQAIVKSTNCNGCYYALKRSRTRTPKRNGAPTWLASMKLPIARLNRLVTRGLADSWANYLSQATRDAWETLSATATWTNYDGSPGTQNGFSLWLAVNRFRRYSNFFPSSNGASLFTPLEIINGYKIQMTSGILPSPWAQPPAPSVASVEIFDGNTAFCVLNNPPNPFELVMETVQAVNFKSCSATQPKKYIATPNLPSISDFESEVFISFDYPGPEFSIGKAKRLGMRYTNFVNNNFSEPTWIQL